MKVQIFMTKKYHKAESNHSCLAVIGLDSTFKTDEIIIRIFKRV